jgi:hypothetical protein
MDNIVEPFKNPFRSFTVAEARQVADILGGVGVLLE